VIAAPTPLSNGFYSPKRIGSRAGD
jgi:hypothetical protein